MSRMLALFLLCFLLFPSPTQSADLPKTDPKVVEQLKTYLLSHYMTPEDYVISKFQDHDVVFLGEEHLYRPNLQLVQALIPRLYQKGIFTLAIEFARHEDQPLIDRLLNAPNYDEVLARQITFNQYVFWGFQEYVDVYKTAWHLNHQLPGGSRRFRILGVNCSPDWSVIQREEDEHNHELRVKVWQNCGKQPEESWAKVILDEVVAKREKALVYSGMHHAFTRYRQPIYSEEKQGFAGFGDVRMGNFVFNAVGKRAFTISLHMGWPSEHGYDKPDTYAADGYIDALMANIGPKFRRAGFDTRGTPFGNLPGNNSVYKYGYENFTLTAFCDGYIIQGPLHAYEGVTPIKDFVNESNLAHARSQSPDPKFRHATSEEFNRAIAEDELESQKKLTSFH